MILWDKADDGRVGMVWSGMVGQCGYGWVKNGGVRHGGGKVSKVG